MAHNGNSNGPKDSKPDDGSDSISQLSGDVNSVNKNDDGSNTDCGKSNIEDGHVPTPVPNDEIENTEKLAALVRKVLHNENLSDDKMEWSLCLLIESEQSVEISQEDLTNMILHKTAQVMAIHGQSHIAHDIFKTRECKRQQLLYYRKYKELSESVKKMNS